MPKPLNPPKSLNRVMWAKVRGYSLNGALFLSWEGPIVFLLGVWPWHLEGHRDLGVRDLGVRDLGFRDLGFRGLGLRVWGLGLRGRGGHSSKGLDRDVHIASINMCFYVCVCICIKTT